MPNFVEIGPHVLEKILEGFFTIYGRGSQFGHVTRISQAKFKEAPNKTSP